MITPQPRRRRCTPALRALGAVAWSLALLTTLAGCSAWVVRPLNSETGKAQTGAAAFSAATYVDGIWASKVVPTIDQQAEDAGKVLAALAADPTSAKAQYGHQEGSGRPYNFMVKGDGKVLKVDTSTRTGKLTVDLPPYDGKADITVQIGPVMSGTALRDGVGFIHYSEFTNQIDYAGVADELNNRVLKDVIAPLDVNSLTGQTVSFEGIFPRNDLDPTTLVLTPVRLSAKGSE